MSDNKTRLVPKLRFPEFRGAGGWQPKTLAEICHLITNGKANAQDHEDDGEYPLFDRSAVIKKSREFIFDAEAVILPGEGMRFVPKYFRGKFNLHQRAYALMQHQGDGRFVYHSLDYFQDVLAEKAVKSTVLSLRLPIVENFVIGCPSSAEQQKIADCLSSLDELIAALARKVNALKTHKKGLMQQLFPMEGETQPRLRFPEFRDAGEWAPKRLSGMIDLISGMHLSPDAYSTTGEVPYFTGPSDFTNDLQSVTKWTKRSANVSLAEDTLITVKGSGVGEIWYSMLPEVAMGRQLMAVRTKRGSSRFIFQFLLTKRSRFGDLGSGNLIPGLSRAVILELEAHFPSPFEQQRIADCLTSLDNLITAATQELETLKTHKKGLMQQLFPSTEVVEA